MKMRTRILAAALLGGTAFVSSKAFAAPTISYQYNTGVTTSYSTTSGGTISVPVYFQETLSGGAASLIDNDGGLQGAGFSATETSGTIPNGYSGVYSIAGATASFGPSGSVGTYSEKSGDAANNTQTTFRAEKEITTNSPGPETASSTLTGSILLGYLTIEGGTAATTTSFTVGNFLYSSTNGGYTTTVGTGTGTPYAAGPYDLDKSTYDGATANPSGTTAAGGAAGATTFTVVVTPEPASLSLGVLGAVGLLARRRNRQIASIA